MPIRSREKIGDFGDFAFVGGCDQEVSDSCFDHFNCRSDNRIMFVAQRCKSDMYYPAVSDRNFAGGELR